jgi:hypothetical protein
LCSYCAKAYQLVKKNCWILVGDLLATRNQIMCARWQVGQRTLSSRIRCTRRCQSQRFGAWSCFWNLAATEQPSVTLHVSFLCGASTILRERRFFRPLSATTKVRPASGALALNA